MKKIKFVLPVLLAIGCLYGFRAPENDGFIVKVVKNFMIRSKMFPQEKLYLHTDRENYGAGDKIWFRAYLQDAMTHQPSGYSRYVYVELTDRQDSVWQRVKLREQDSVFAGYMELPEEIQQGEYFLRAYSYWMQNQGEEFLFRKRIKISNIKNTRVLAQTDFERGGEGYQAKIVLRGRDGNAYSNVAVYYRVIGPGMSGKERLMRTDDKGQIIVNFDPATRPSEISIRLGESASVSFNQHIYIPKQLSEFQVQFFPEGGDLLAGGIRTVAFKAVGVDGLAVEVEGHIYDDRDKIVADFKTGHKGMGQVGFWVEDGRRYRALAKSSDGLEHWADLPEVKGQGVALQVAVRANRLIYSVSSANNMPLPAGLFLLEHCRGKLMFVDSLSRRPSGVLSLKNFPEGINHFLIVDTLGRIYSQRLVFVRNRQRPEISIKADKPEYAAREKMALTLDLAGTVGGSFSLSVVDSGAERPDSLSGNILSSLLLTSDLKGYVEDPGYYFREADKDTDGYLDLLMLTQGWTRFEVGDLIVDKFPELPYFLERGQVISGQVKNFWGKEASDARLILLSTSGLLRTATTDSAGKFAVSGIAYSDGARFILQAHSKKGRKSVEVLVDKDIFLPPRCLEPYGMKLKAEDDDFARKFGGAYYYENGVKIYVLDEVQVRARKADKVETYYELVADYRLDSAKIAGLNCPDISLLLQSVPGVLVDGNSISRFGKPLLLIVNDMEESVDGVLTVHPLDLLSVSYLSSLQSSALFGGSRGENGALVLELNRNYARQGLPRVNLKTFRALGYQKPASYYVPAYGVDSVRMALQAIPDERVTVYWNPSISITPGKPERISFYTADYFQRYKVILEGVLEDGTACRKEMEF